MRDRGRLGFIRCPRTRLEARLWALISGDYRELEHQRMSIALFEGPCGEGISLREAVGQDRLRGPIGRGVVPRARNSSDHGDQAHDAEAVRGPLQRLLRSI
jgi:hypothetical protein